MNTDRESVKCFHCGSEPGHACEFPAGPAPMVDDGSRRVVHAARYAETLPPDERGLFWEKAIENYLSTELAAMNATAPDKDDTPNG